MFTVLLQSASAQSVPIYNLGLLCNTEWRQITKKIIKKWKWNCLWNWYIMVADVNVVVPTTLIQNCQVSWKCHKNHFP